MVQWFKLYLAGGLTIDVALPQEELVSADDFFRYLKSERTTDGHIVVDDSVSLDARALIGVEKVQAPSTAGAKP